MVFAAFPPEMMDIKDLQQEEALDYFYDIGYYEFILFLLLKYYLLKFNHFLFHRVLPRPTKSDDYEMVEEDILEALHQFTLNDVIPAIMKHLEKNNYPRLGGIPVQFYPFEKLVLLSCPLPKAFTPDQQYDLHKMAYIALPWLQGGGLCKIIAQESVGAAIRICKAIDKPKYADRFNEIVKGCFVPDEYQKELAPIKKSFFY